MKIKDAAHSIKFWIAFVVLVIGTLTAAGAFIDRPLFLSEMNQHKIEAQVSFDATTANSADIIQIKVDTVQRQIWSVEDRQDVKPTQDGKQRLRELKIQHERLKKVIEYKRE